MQDYQISFHKPISFFKLSVKNKRKCPIEPAKAYEIGFTKVSENDDS